MFELKKENLVEYDKALYKIVSDYEDLMYYDGPIVFSGKNQYGTIIVGCIIDNDYEGGYDANFIMFLSKVDYDALLISHWTMRDLVESSDTVHIRRFFWEPDRIEMYKVLVKDIPEEYMPTKDSYLDFE